MRKLLKVYKSLPKEVLMLLAMAGLGTPIGIIYVLQRWIFPNTPMFVVILYVIGAIVVIGLIGLLIAWLFNRGAKKRSRKMAAELAGGAESGPVSMDVRAAIKENNDKFFAAIRDMRKLGISVYELPWYVIIGDSGCGKTRLINEGGLTFSTGKPEGYQLGTLNYNWWFTEDAIFVDMAGRLCNPKEDSDYREWEAFLNSVKKGRKGFPINGVIACVSADHLLQDPPERLEQDANTMLERLRDLQNKLGVTFATYLVITKCDKILGFMQFFDRAERDITIKNQIFGWSRPGDFKELYDPEKFRNDFEFLYGRLNDLRLRRLNDDADEMDLGLAHGFPEEFRGMLEPLQIYVRTLFPAIKQPRAIKNLIFRGIYFTSATQEGSLILKHLTERLGTEAADQFAPLDLYPNKRPHFIRDVFFRKVFPEHGLVFRNEEQAERNRKWAKILNFGAAGLCVVLILLLIWSGTTFANLIDSPRKKAKQSTQVAKTIDPYNALNLASAIDRDVDQLRARTLPAKVLSLGHGSDEPIRDLERIQLSAVERLVIRQALKDVETALRSTDLTSIPDRSEAEHRAAEYMNALEQYLMWYGCAGEDSPPSALDNDSFRTLWAAVQDKQSIVHHEDFEKQTGEYFLAVTEGKWEESPARLLRQEGFQPSETILTAIERVHRYMTRFATLNTQHPNDTIQRWIRIQDRCATIQGQYSLLLDQAEALQEARTFVEVEGIGEQFVESFARFDEAFAGVGWESEEGRLLRIPSIKDAILAQRGIWRSYEQKLREGYTTCPGADERQMLNAIASLSTGTADGRPGLDQILWADLKAKGLTTAAYSPDNYDRERFDRLVEEVYEAYPHIIRHFPGEGVESDRIELTADAKQVRTRLREIRDNMAAVRVDAGDTSAETMDEWIERASTFLGARKAKTDAVRFGDDFDLSERWRREDLEQLYISHQEIIRRGEATQLLNTIQERLTDVGDWGLAEIAGADPNWCAEQQSVYHIPSPPCGPSDEREPRRARDRNREEEPQRPARRGWRSGRTPVPEPRTRDDRRTSGRGGIPNAAEREFLVMVVDQWYELNYQLGLFDPRDLLGTSEERPLSELCIQQIDDAGERYFETYVGSWSDAYAGKAISSIDELKQAVGSWQALAGNRSLRAAIDNELGDALETLLAALPYWPAYPDPRDPNRWVVDGGPYDRYMFDALDKEWDRSLGTFVFNRELPARFMDGEWYRDDPASMIAGEFVRRWGALLNALEEDADFRSRFNRAMNSRTLTVHATKIPWGAIQELREETALAEEKFTQQLVDFERHVKTLLSMELTDVLAEIQESHFQGVPLQAGWPFARESSTTVETVEFEEFVEFLVDVGQAQDKLSTLEQDLDDEMAQIRDDFYRACTEWRRFLGLSDDGRTTPLPVTVWGDDPVNDPRYAANRIEDTSQLYYNSVELYLGDLSWTPERGGPTQQGPLRRATTTDARNMRFETEWDWSQSADRRQYVGLRDGGFIGRTSQRREPVEENLGRVSPLALCAYLKKHGVPDPERRTWRTLHTFEVSTSATTTKVIGEMFVIKLDRPMPDPIRPMRMPERRD